MALYKEKDWKYGLKTTYWSVDEVEVKYPASTAIVVVNGYLSENSKKVDHGQPTEQMTIQLTGDDFTFVKGCNVEETVYTVLKRSKIEKETVGGEIQDVEKNYFADATDC